MFKTLLTLLEIWLTKSPIKIYWEQEDQFTKIGYFTPDDVNVQFITLSHQTIDETSLLFVTFGGFVNGQRKLALTKKNSGQFLILGTVLRAIKQELAEDQVLIFTAKREFDGREEYEHRRSFYALIAQAQHKRIGGSFGKIDIEDGTLFYLSKHEIPKSQVLRLLGSQKMLSLAAIKSTFKNGLA